jgi:hypothetical protein
MSTVEIESRLVHLFQGTGRSAAVSEVRTAEQYPAYLDGIVQNVRGCPTDVALLVWAMRRGFQWDKESF